RLLTLTRSPPSSTLFPYTSLFRSLAVELNRAGAAHTVLAADVRSRQPRLVANEVREEEPRLDGPLVRDGVDLEDDRPLAHAGPLDRKSTRLNSSHRTISYAVFCLK